MKAAAVIVSRVLGYVWTVLLFVGAPLLAVGFLYGLWSIAFSAARGVAIVSDIALGALALVIVMPALLVCIGMLNSYADREP